jgi:catechol 2,3-dioxygenase-like lactoylglutathione lyase family enzyme
VNAARRTLHATLPVSDLGRARAFYEGRLGFETFDENEEGVYYRGAEGTFLALYLSSFVGANPGTGVASWSQMSKLKSRNFAPRGSCSKSTTYRRLKTENGIVTFRFYRAAWFKDPDGNILGSSRST